MSDTLLGLLCFALTLLFYYASKWLYGRKRILPLMPLLLAPTPAPTFDQTQPLSFRALFRISPLGCAGMLLTGGVFSAMFGMASVWGAMEGLSVRDISIFIGALYVGGLVLQYPIGWVSDRMDRRKLIMGLSALAAVVIMIQMFTSVDLGMWEANLNSIDPNLLNDRLVNARWSI